MASAPGALKAPYGVAPIYSVHSNGDLWMFEYDDPSGGSFTWGQSYQIGSGWGGRTLAGPAGWVYSVTTGGALQLFHYNGSIWDDLGGGELRTLFSSGWSYTGSGTRNRITTDEDGVLYTLSSTGDLKAWLYNTGTGAWDVQNALLDTGLTQYTAIYGSSRGVLYARTSTGALFRYYIDFWSSTTPRWVRPTAQIGSGWNALKGLTSPGADVLMGVATNGNLYWYSYNPTNNTWAASAGYVVGYGWGAELDVVAQCNACTRFDTATLSSSTGPTDGGAAAARLTALRKN